MLTWSCCKSCGNWSFLITMLISLYVPMVSHFMVWFPSSKKQQVRVLHQLDHFPWRLMSDFARKIPCSASLLKKNREQKDFFYVINGLASNQKMYYLRHNLQHLLALECCYLHIMRKTLVNFWGRPLLLVLYISFCYRWKLKGSFGGCFCFRIFEAAI